MFKKLLIALYCTLLAGCSFFEPRPPVPASDSWQQQQAQLMRLTHWEINGKIGIVTPEERNSASLKWQQQAQDYSIDIVGPLGSGGFSIQGTEQQVTVSISGEPPLHGPSPEYILFRKLGWDIPISDIYWWIRGLPAPNTPYQHSLEHNRLKTLQQNGWDIQYLRYNNLKPALPRKLKLSRGELKITLVLYSWQAY